MFGKRLVRDMINRSAENETDRRRFLTSAGMVGLGAVGASVLPALGEGSADAAVSDGAVLNFALNLEYLEAEFYSYAVHGHGLAEKLTHGTGTRGGVTGGKKVPFKTKKIRDLAEEIAADELHHVEFLRTALGSAAVSRPAIDIKNSFTAAARAAGLISASQTFDPYASEDTFLIGGFVFEDVGVTAYKGAAPLITNKTYLGAAAGILAVEAYHAAALRTQIINIGGPLVHLADGVSKARDSVDGKMGDDQGVRLGGKFNTVPTGKYGLAFGRSPSQVLNIVYLNPKKVSKGGFFPKGVNGTFTTSGSNA